MPGCRTEDRQVTDWFRVEDQEGALDGAKRQVYYTLGTHGWRRIASGRAGGATRLYGGADGDADRVRRLGRPSGVTMDAGMFVIFVSGYGEEAMIIQEGEEAARRVSEVFEGHRQPYVVPSRQWVDFVECVRPGPGGRCLDVEALRYDPLGRKQWHRRAAVDDSGRGCALGGLAPIGYDSDYRNHEAPFFEGKCEDGTCVLLGLRDEPFRFEARSPGGCGHDWHRRTSPSAPLSLLASQPFDLSF